MKALNGVNLNAALLGKGKWLARSSIIDPYEHLPAQEYRCIGNGKYSQDVSMGIMRRPDCFFNPAFHFN